MDDIEKAPAVPEEPKAPVQDVDADGLTPSDMEDILKDYEQGPEGSLAEVVTPEKVDSEAAAEVVPAEKPAEPTSTEVTPEPKIAEVLQPQPAPVSPEATPGLQPTPPLQPEPETRVVTDQERVELRNRFVNEMEARYKLSDADKELMQTEPEKVLPRLAANLYVDIAESLVGLISANLPSYILQVSEQTRTQKAAEEKFFERFPELNDADGRRRALEVARVYAQLNPKASLEQGIEEIGLQTMMLLKRTPKGVTPSVQPPTSSAPVRFSPATPRGATAEPAKRQSDNFFEAFSREVEKLDAEDN